ncbi:MAG: ATP-dependent DNA ligase [Patescibacteria group bacterium]
MLFSELTTYFDAIEQTSGRLEITKQLAELLVNLSPDEIEKTAYLLQGRVVPLYQKADFGMAEKMVVKAIQSACSVDAEGYRQVHKQFGDIGKTVEQLKNTNPTLHTQELTIAQVYQELFAITQISGEGSQEEKQKILAQLISDLSPTAARYIVRIPIGALRLGFSDMTVLDAYSWMLTGDKKLRKRIEAAYHVRPDLGYIGRQLKEHGIESMDSVTPQLFTPILMMRAERMSSGVEILEKVGPCAVEPKYDGFRLQIHYQKETQTVKLYTRGLEHVSMMYPDIVEAVQSELDVDSIILEGEALGYVPETEALLPFQETVQRKRKYNIVEKVKEIPLKLFAFELLYLDGESYINKPYMQRRKMIESVVKAGSDFAKGTILAAPSTVYDNATAIEQSFDTAITDGLEGIIAKKLDGVYQAGARGSNWLKFKRSYASSAIDDTIDCVVLGYDYGKGKRASFGIGAFLAGVYDAASDSFVTVAKIGTGLTDHEWREMKKRCDAIEVKELPIQYSVDSAMQADVYVSPQIVVEIRADEITRSPVHTAGRTLKQSKSGSAKEVDEPGYALRFPRLERFRDDKRIEDATTVSEIVDLEARAHKR